MMRTNTKRRRSVLLTLFLSLALLAGAVVTRGVFESFAASPSPAEAVREAWRKARDTGYGFEAGVEQTLIPRPVWSQLGRQEEQVSFYLEGEVEQPGHSRVRVWPETGPPNAVVAGTLGQINPAAIEPLMEIIQEGSKTIIRERGQERVAESPASLAAPGGDYLAYLEAARDVEQIAVRLLRDSRPPPQEGVRRHRDGGHPQHGGVAAVHRLADGSLLPHASRRGSWPITRSTTASRSAAPGRAHR